MSKIAAADYMNFNRPLIWYTSETGVPLDRDQVDCRSEDNTCQPTSDNTLSNSLRCIALLFSTTSAAYVIIERCCQERTNAFLSMMKTWKIKLVIEYFDF